jgi:PHD/YefM family antitoxin component YafN of YafNO toxin-antitoxin module
LNSRKIVVGFPSHSNLREVAKQMGESFQGMGTMSNLDEEQLVSRHNAEQAVVQSLELYEAWDILDALKKMLSEDRRGNKLRAFVEENPQAVNAIYELEKRLGIALPTHILMAQPKPPVAIPAVPPASSVGGNVMGWNNSGNNIYDSNNQSGGMNTNNMWGGTIQQQQQQLFGSNMNPIGGNMGMNIGLGMDAYNMGMNMNINMPADFSSGNATSGGDGGQQQSSRRSRFN